jgi:primosomal protein N' (replication factor Y)
MVTKRTGNKGLCCPGNRFVEVAVALPVSKTFTYEMPEPLLPYTEVGKRVLVPFRNLQVTGYILDLREATDQEGVKKVLDILDEVPLFPPSMIQFFRWISEYYLYPLGEIVKGALPGGLNVTQVQTVRITEKGHSALSSATLKTSDRAVLETLENRGPLGLRTLLKTLKEDISLAALRSLERAGWIIREQKLKPGRVRPKKEWHVRSVESRPSPASLSPVRLKILTLVEGYREMSFKALRAEVPSAGRLVKKMAADGLLDVVERSVYRDPFGEPIKSDDAPPTLTEEQASVVTTLLEKLGRGFQTYLLYGITGSGKTEVYMRAVAAALDQGYQALVLVPEIALISQTERLFRARFGDCIALLHSGLSQGERFDQWMRIVRKEASVAIGARSAIFAPLDRLGLIIVDEEHDDSYKQESKLRYHARDLAVVRAKFEGAVALLGSATPSVQSYYNVQAKKFKGLNLWKRVENQGLPDVEVVDLRETQEGGRYAKPFMTEELKEAVAETLNRGEQVLLFLNRRGFANYPTCTCCGEPVRCKNCDVTMTLHQGTNAFRCHYCGYSCAQTVGCRACGSPNIKLLGVGTEQVEAKVRTIFPEARIARIDRDTTARKGALLRMLKDLREGSIDILVGTQMVAKGHHYPNITLVGILCADLSLNFPDFRSGERTFQLLAQVAGRAGRGSRRGRVILQTLNPDHFCVVTARDQDYPAFYEHEIRFRRDLQYPPYCRLIQILVAGKDKGQTARYAQSLGDVCRALQSENKTYQKEIRLLGPVAAPLARIKKAYRWQLLLKGLRVEPLHALTKALRTRAEREIPKAAVKVVVDVDPMDML